jgi:hypothetical protein
MKIGMNCIKVSHSHASCCSNDDHLSGFYNTGLTDLVTCPVVAIVISDYKTCSYRSEAFVMYGLLLAGFNIVILCSLKHLKKYAFKISLSMNQISCAHYSIITGMLVITITNVNDF